jgi:hypothetical protein
MKMERLLPNRVLMRPPDEKAAVFLRRNEGFVTICIFSTG